MARRFCFVSGFVSVAAGLINMFQTVDNVRVHTPVSPILIVGILWLPLAFSYLVEELSREPLPSL